MGGRVLVLFVDRTARARWSARLGALASDGHSILEAETARQVEAEVEAGAHDAVLLVVPQTGEGERRLVDLVSRLSETAAVVVAGAQPEAFRRDLLIAGAWEVLAGPPGDAEVGDALARSVRAARALGRAARFDPERPLTRTLGASPSVGAAIRLIARAATSSAPVLVRGETGSGKSILARSIHAHERSPRRGGPFVRCLLRAVDPGDLERSLYGGGRRPGLFDLAQGGTVYLEDVESLPPADQTRLLEILKTEAAPRIIAGTSVSLDAAVKEGRFKRDLLAALKVLPIDLPALRERPGDIPALATETIDRRAARLGKSILGLTPGAIALLQRHTWPGNLRELDGCLARAVARAEGILIGEEDLADLERAPGLPRDGAATGAPGALEIVVCVDETLPAPEIARRAAAVAEIVAIRRALERCGGNVSRAARVLMVSRSWLQKRMRIHRLRVKG
ncbi:MAG TPA: sigma 54-interacting transcriptional regulator [Candidatus Polarisedimenticolia bacterium]